MDRRAWGIGFAGLVGVSVFLLLRAAPAPTPVRPPLRANVPIPAPGASGTLLTSQGDGVTPAWESFPLVTPPTVAAVGTANTPYSVLHTDVLVELDTSAGALIQANLPASSLTVGESHCFTLWKFAGSAPPPVINGNGNNVQPYAQGTQASGALAATTTIRQPGGFITLVWDGTQWMITALQ